MEKLTADFYRRDALTVARELLGKIFVRRTGGKTLSGKIVEVEAYKGSIDEAAHTFRGKTKRNEIMFEEGGLLYVYFTYGAHFCCNVVAGRKDEGDAALLRAIEPIEGVDVMAANRGFDSAEISDKILKNLTSGPGKICQALNIIREDNGTNLLGDEIFLLNAAAVKDKDVVVCKRVGITRSVDFPWRFYIKNNPYVSKK
jgi:DNA-3-methyladenine glycosylase